jgi:hypothetical protein
MFQRFFCTVLLAATSLAALAFTHNVRDTDLFVLKNGYTFKADVVDTTGKYYVYKVYRGERLLRCVKKTEVSEIKFNYITPTVVAIPPAAIEVKPTVKTEPVKPAAPVIEKRIFNPYTAQLKVRKGFEVIDTVRIFYDLDLTHYKTDDNAINAFTSAVDLGPAFTQKEIDSTVYQGLKQNGKRNGAGILFFDNGAVFSGKIVNNVMQGYGYYSDEIIDYKGMFANNVLNGLGICYYFGIEDLLKEVVFKGEFRAGKFWEGELYYTTSDNKRFVQLFKLGNPSAAKMYDE